MAGSKKSRSNRFNSFDLSVSESKESNLKNIIFELQTFLPKKSCDLTDIDKLIEEFKEKYCDGNEEYDNFTSLSPFEERFVDVALKDSRCLEIIKSIRSLMLEGTSNVENVTNWDTLLKSGFKYQNYHTFCYTLMRLTEVSQDKTSRELAFNVGRTYFCLMALPGAKRCQIWDTDLVMEFFKLFSYHKPSSTTYSDYDDKFLEIQVIQMLDECKNVFNIVCLSDQEEVLEKYIETLSSTLETFTSSSRHTAHDIIMKCYENFELLCLKPLPDKEIEKIMYLIFCRTSDLHFVSQKAINRMRGSSSKHGESISDFFLYLLTNYFEKTKNVLVKFIRSILSTPNLDHKFDKDKCVKLFDIAVKYELAIYLKCNESIIEYLEKLALASDQKQRLNCVEFCGKMLLVNSTPDPNQQPSTVEIPREALIIKLLFEKVYDKQDNVKLKALTSIKAGLVNGNEYTKKIFGIIFKKKSTEDNPEIVQVLAEDAENFQLNLISLLQTSTATYIRKACLEILGQNCENLLDNEIFYETLTSLTEDNSYLVKSNLIEIVNQLIFNHPTNKNVLDIWLDVILDLIRDNDNKIVDASVKALTGIFQKIESFENTINEIQLLPWNIVRKIMAKNKRSLLQQAMSSVSTNFLSQEKLRKIETHIFTSHKSEAWCILSLIAKRMKSNNPDIVVKTFLDHLDKIDDHSFESNDFHLILEVIQNWTSSFNVNSKTQIASKITELLEKGSCPVSLVHHLYEICTLARTILFGKEEIVKFQKSLNERSKNYVLEHSKNFAESGNEKFLCFLLLYCETNTDLPKRPEKALLEFLFDFLRKIDEDKIKVSIENDTPRKLNCCIIVMTRFAVRDNELASDLTPLLAGVLKKKNMHISCVKTSMQCLNDLCKKHTATVTPVFKEIIYKLHSPNEEIRLCALANVFDLVMQDFLKLRGRLLLNFLACLVDKNELIQLKSQAAILSYAADKNQNLLYTCFLDSVFLFNDFVQADNFGVFPLEEIDRNHRLLHGEDKTEQRFELYKFFVQNIHEMNESHLLMLLKQIIIFTDKLDKKKFKKSENGVRTFKDLLYIFKLICEKRADSKLNVSKNTENAEYADDDDEELAHTSTVSQQKTTRKKQNALTMTDAIPIVEKMLLIYPKFVVEIIEYDSSLATLANELTQSIVKHFSSFIEYSNSTFWSEAQNSAETPTSKKRKKTSKKTAHFCGDSSSDENE